MTGHTVDRLAACADADPAEWDDEGTPHAHNLCRTCPARPACLEDAREGVTLANGSIVRTNGVMRAGVVFDHRGRETKPKPPKPKTDEHGTNAGYCHHCYTRTEPCESCRAAHAQYEKVRRRPQK